MNQYTVMPQCKHSEILRKVTPREYNKVLGYMYDLGIEGYVQDGSSANSDFIPKFDLSGI